MTNFVKYPHLERLGTDEVDGIYMGRVHIFPKLDGTNASFWWESGELQCGSRNRILSLEADNAGFYAWANQQKNIKEIASQHPHLRFFGEWLVPHSLKTYRDDAWRKLYVFDVFDTYTGEFHHYDTYKPLLEEYSIDFIPCVCVATNPSYEQLTALRDRTTFLIQDGQGAGEGIVVKQYGWKNKFGRTTWAKLVTNSFKDAHVKEMGGSVITNTVIEEEIANEFITQHVVDKIVAKIQNEKEQFGSKDIPQLLHSAFHDLVTEELWQAIKKHKNPKIDFKLLQTCAFARVKQLKAELFGR